MGRSLAPERAVIRRAATAILALAAPLLGGCGGSEPGSDEAAARPNVVVVMTDDQTLAELRHMPRTRELVGEAGARFSNYFVSFPLCCPSRASYLTGRYAHNNGVLANDPRSGGGYTALDNRHTLAVWMDRAGYETASIGRYLNFYGVEVPQQVPPGWDEWHAPPGPSTYLMYDYTLNHNGELVTYGSEPSDYQTDVYADLAVEFVRSRAGEAEPFFLSVTPLAPHDENDEAVPSPFDGPRPAPRHADRLGGTELPDDPSLGERDTSDKPPVVRGTERAGREQRRIALGSWRRRARSLLAVDEMVERLVVALRDSGQLANTWVFFTSDNGYLLGEHRLKGKITPYEEVVRVPLLVRGPGVEPETVVRSESANIDLAPTIAELGGAEPDRSVDGISLLPALLEGRERKRNILLENLDEGRVPDQPLYAGVINRDFSYVSYEPRGTELYDLRRDPDQLENAAGERRYRVPERRLSVALERLRDCRGTGCR